MEIKTCSLPDCKEVHYAKGFCRRHYRTQIQEHKRYYDKNKDLPEFKKKMSDSRKRYYKEHQRGNEVYLKKTAKHQYNHYHNNNTGRKAYLKEWKKNLSLEKKRLNYKRDNEKRWFGGKDLVERVLKKFNYKCAVCGMTNEEHKNKFKSRLDLHHQDGLGRNTPTGMKNNNEDNLIVLCRSCHMKVEKGVPLL